jgi:hypothetical protein
LPAGLERRREDLKVTLPDQVRNVCQFHAKAQVGLVTAETGHRLGVRQPEKGRDNLFVRNDGADHFRKAAFDQVKDVLLLDKGHFQI